jgi:hypothetical protein
MHGTENLKKKIYLYLHYFNISTNEGYWISNKRFEILYTPLAVQAYYLSTCEYVCACVRVHACGTVLHFNSAVILVGGNRMNALSVGGRCRSAFMDLYSRMLEYPFFFSLSREIWGHYHQIDNDLLLTNSCLFTVRDYAPIRFAACKTAKFIRTFHRIRVF